MKQLNLPAYSFRIDGKEGSERIFDTLRRKWVRLTPEEWVRQNFVRYLVNEGGYPPGLIGIEINFQLGKMKKRVDILVHDRRGNPVMIIECKAPEVRISDFYENKVYDQVGEYNFGFRVPFALVTNGLMHYAFRFNTEKNIYEHLLEIPLYEDLLKLL
ncbi:MAG TPA: type I restriction enzyme HsdR N-terminal domain-containing protein [Bacteroidales bacterium]|nr:type I restriction enzyme HsdR N-terminal domain-containing protein [Bacteroidales bacterium]